MSTTTSTATITPEQIFKTIKLIIEKEIHIPSVLITLNDKSTI